MLSYELMDIKFCSILSMYWSPEQAGTSMLLYRKKRKHGLSLEAEAMSISETAHKNHEKLFPERQSTWKVTDPELLEIFENFAFDEVMEHGKLDEKTRMLVILASLIAQQTLSEYKTMLEAALNVGVKPIEVKELVYQSVPYCGFAKVVDFIDSTNEILIKRGIELPLKRQATITRETRYEKGFALQKEIFGDEAIETMYRNCPDNQLPIQRFLSDNCFGDYYTRQGLDLPMRELLTFSMILSLGGCEPQLKGHIQGNANVGNDKEMLFDVIVQLLPYLGYPRTLNAIRCLNEALPDEQ